MNENSGARDNNNKKRDKKTKTKKKGPPPPPPQKKKKKEEEKVSYRIEPATMNENSGAGVRQKSQSHTSQNQQQ